MSKQLHKYIKTCIECQFNKLGTINKQELCKTNTPMEPFQVVQINLQGPFLTSLNDNRYIVTMVCELTKYLVAIPISNKEAKTVANAIFEGFITTFGPMKTILTDLGTEFKNRLTTEFNKLLDISHDFSTTYHFRTFGVVERNHRTSNEYLRTDLRRVY